jgi:putative ABC transport system permease protein
VTPDPTGGLVHWPDRLYRRLLLVYPRDVRTRFADEMVELFRARRLAAGRNGWRARLLFWCRVIGDLVSSAIFTRQPVAGLEASHGPSPAAMLRAVRDGFRFVRRSPALSGGIVLLMAISIGAATTIFSVVNAVLIRPLPFGDPDRLVTIWESRPDRQVTRNVVSGHEFPMWQERARAFDAIAAMTYAGGGVTLTEAGEPKAVQGVKVTSAFFEVMGVAPELGRTFRPEEDTPGHGQIVILSHRLWIDRFNGDRGVLGRTARLDGRPYVVVGVMGPTFDFPRAPSGDGVDFWAPLAEPIGNYRGRHFLYVVGRLKREISVEQAQSDMTRVTREIEAELPDLNRGHGAHVVGLQNDLVRDARVALIFLLSAVGSLLLVGCSNVAGLLVANGLRRQQEMTVRMALGASRADVARQLLSESLVLAALGAGLGVLVTYWLTRLVPVFVPRELLMIDNVVVDANVLAFAVAAAIGTGLLFGLAPAMQTRQLGLAGALNSEGRAITGGNSRIRGALVIGQIALSLVLVAAASMLARGLVQMSAIDPGFVTSGVLTTDVTLPAARYPNAVRQRQFATEVVERTTRLPGVTAAAVTNFVPLGPGFSNMSVDIEGRPAAPGIDQTARYRVVSSDYFRTMGIRQVSGRVFTASDTRLAVPLLRWFPQQPLPADFDVPQAAPAAVINEAMAKQFWPDGSPVGRRFKVVFSPWIAVVGVVANTRTTSLREAPVAEFYLSDVQEPVAAVSVLVRTNGDPADLAPPLRQVIRELDTDLAISSMRTLDELARNTFTVPRFTSAVVAVFASLALVLMAAGVYALIAFTTSLRAREIALRLALGADRRQVVYLVAGHALLLAGLGVAVGAAVSVPALRVLDVEWLGGGGPDPVTWIGDALLVTAAVLVGCWAPARRAARIDPAVILRQS